MLDNLRYIRAFLTLARVGNFTRAAAEMYMSQSALTVQIRQLENDVGAILVNRGKRRISLTQAGQDVFASFERLIIDSEEIVSRTQAIAGLRRGLVSIAVLPTIASNLVPSAVKRFTDLYPGVVVQIRDLVAVKITESVKAEEVDFVIGGRPAMERWLLGSHLFTDRMGAFIPDAHPLESQPFVTLKQLSEVSLVLPRRDSSVREIVESAFKRERWSFKYAYEANYLSTALGLAKVGLGIAILPEMPTNSDDLQGITFVPIRRPELRRKIEVLRRSDRTLSPAALKMLEIIQDVARERYPRR